MEDKQIIELFFARKESAISELSRKHGTLCQKIAFNILNNEADAEECVSDAYLAVWKTIPPQRPQFLLSYVCGIVRNISLTRYHHITAEKRNSFYDVALDELADCIPDTEHDSTETEELSEALNEFLRSLPKNDRVMFVKRYWYSEAVSDIAKSFQTSPHYISVKLSRIREKLRKFLEKKGISI